MCWISRIDRVKENLLLSQRNIYIKIKEFILDFINVNIVKMLSDENKFWHYYCLYLIDYRIPILQVCIK